MTIRLARRVQGRGITLIRRVFEGAPADAVNLGLGQPTDPLPDDVRAAAAAAIADGRVPYTPTAGLPALRRALAQHVYPDGPFGGDPESLLVTSGSQEALWVALMGLLDPDDEVIVPEPGYPAYRAATEMMGAKPVPVTLTFESGWKIDTDAIAAAWTPRTRAVIAASPANPTGMFVGDDHVVARLAALCAEREAWLVADEIYSPIRFVEPHAPPYLLGERVVSIGSSSKALSGTGLRVGWIHCHPEIVRGLMPLHQQVALCAPTIGQHATLAAVPRWRDGLVDELHARYAPRRDAMLDALRELGSLGARWQEPEGAFYVLVDLSQVTPEAQDTLALAMRLRDEAKVITAPGESFGLGGAGHLRLSFASDPAMIREGVGRITAFLSRRPRP